MTKKFFLFFLTILIISSVCGLETDLKQNYQQKETMNIGVEGNILEPLHPDQVAFLRGHIEIPLEYEVKKIGEDYFIWALAPNSAGNYSLLLKDVLTMVSGVEKRINYQQSFSVGENIVDYYIKPGFILTRNDFDLTIVLNEDNKKKIVTSYPFPSDIELKPGNNIIRFKIEQAKKNTLLGINIGKYTIPLYVISNLSEEEYRPIKFSPIRIEEIYYEKIAPKYKISIVNTGESEIKGIFIDYNKNIFNFDSKQNINLKPKEVYILNLTIKNFSDAGINEVIYAKYGNYSSAFLIKIGYVNNISSKNDSSKNNQTRLHHCYELSGILCNAGEACSEGIIPSSDGECCLGICKSDSNENNSGSNTSSSWIGYILGVLILVILFYIVYRYKKIKTENNPIPKKIAEAEKKLP